MVIDAVYGLLVAATAALLVVVRRWAAGGVCKSKRRLDGKTVVITGANTGIGKEVAVDLAKRGARVVMACQNVERGQTAVEEVRQRTGSKAVIFRQLDLGHLESVKAFTTDILREESTIDILINNAALWACPYHLTTDGFEMQFGVNYLGHYYLTRLLLDRLKDSAPSRIINVGSRAYEIGKINFNDLMSKQSYGRMKAYSQSKLAIVLFAKELTSRLEETGVTVYTVHPGCVRTELQRHVYNHPVLGYVYNAIYPFLCVLWKSPSEGAQTTIHCAVDEELHGVSGKYYTDCSETKLKPHAEDNAVAKKLWEVSERHTGLV
eukprot:m.62058 g.62058  ORF g.62058 m.62058 type:complete len:321 (+) comp35035_c0_seq1:1427-2389(+)